MAHRWIGGRDGNDSSWVVLRFIVAGQAHLPTQTVAANSQKVADKEKGPQLSPNLSAVVGERFAEFLRKKHLRKGSGGRARPIEVPTNQYFIRGMRVNQALCVHCLQMSLGQCLLALLLAVGTPASEASQSPPIDFPRFSN